MIVLLISFVLSGSFDSKMLMLDYNATQTPNAPDFDQLAKQQKKLFIIISLIVFIVVALGISGYIFYKNKCENNDELQFTRAIIGDDAFEFSQLDTI